MLNKIVSEKLQREGFSKVSEDFTLPQAVEVLGAKLFEKNAQYFYILKGIEALQKLGMK